MGKLPWFLSCCVAVNLEHEMSNLEEAGIRFSERTYRQRAGRIFTVRFWESDRRRVHGPLEEEEGKKWMLPPGLPLQLLGLWRRPEWTETERGNNLICTPDASRKTKKSEVRSHGGSARTNSLV